MIFSRFCLFFMLSCLCLDSLADREEIIYEGRQKKGYSIDLADELEKSAKNGQRYKIEYQGNILRDHIVALRQTNNQIIDIVFLVDSSASVGSKNFLDEIKFVRKLLSAFSVGENATRVSVVTFSSRSRIVRQVDYISFPGLNRHKCMLLDTDLKAISYRGGGTYTVGALREAKRIFKKSRAEATKAVFLITDGFSNGGDPRPEAKRLRKRGIKIFTFGIRNGYVKELVDMASHPKNETCYILESFEEFEALARRALHADLQDGRYIHLKAKQCNRLCLNSSHCCDDKAKCICGSFTGKYDCLCPPGYYGDGLRGGCIACPSGTYKPHAKLGDITTCHPCHDENHSSPLASTRSSDCVCKVGYKTNHLNGCQVLRCPHLSPPKYGYFVHKTCETVFNAVCGIRCNSGFRLQGSSLRMCKSNGEWTGDPVKCQVKRCATLVPPKNGQMICSKDDSSYNTVCRFTCDSGHRLVGSRKRACLAISHWTGITTRCKEITCAPLASVTDGTVTPDTCTQSPVRFGTICAMTCRRGYTLNGPAIRQCTTIGYWTPSAFSKPSQCLDHTPPLLYCPDDIKVNTDYDSELAEVEWNFPSAIDNSGYIPSMSAVPSFVSPAKFPIGMTTIVYTATDLANQNSTCSFHVNVIDNEKPRIERCVSPPPIFTSLSFVNVTWETPVFSDNSLQNVSISQSHSVGEAFGKGKTGVVYTAWDASGNNASCTVWIHILDHKCTLPEAPINGQKFCVEGETGITCNISCDKGHEFTEDPPPTYWCSFLTGLWQPKARMPFPNCAIKQLSRTLVQAASARFSSAVPCAKKKLLTKLQKSFHKLLVTQVQQQCGEDAVCSVNEFETTCEDETVISTATLARRKRRSIDDDKNLGHRSLIIHDFTIKSSMKERKNETIIETAEKSSDEIQKQDRLLTQHERLVDSLEVMATRGEFDVTSGHTTDTRYTPQLPFQMSTPTLQCEEGSILKNKICVFCPVGTFYNKVLPACEFCAKGTYQPRSGQLACLVCPPNMSTDSTNAKNISQCKRQCEPGSFSQNGLEMCETCAIGTYQPHYASTSCNQCMVNHTTVKRGRSNADDCKEICPAGYVSQTGMDPCLPCPTGTYQEERGQTICYKCPLGSGTSSTGASNVNQCLNKWGMQAEDSGNTSPKDKLEFNACFSLPCKNGATCEFIAPRSFKCECMPGYAGVVCDIDIDECVQRPCLNYGTCLDKLNDYECLCVPGFTGKKCESNIDDCVSGTCSVNSTCVDLINAYRCNCFPGFTGTNCDMTIDKCSSGVCLNGAQCIETSGNYNCVCRRGFTGRHCEVDINECALGNSSPCQNNGTCIDGPASFRCVCTDGYTGQFCEKPEELSVCVGAPCLNNARCQSRDGTYFCVCTPQFFGLNCENDIKESYMLDYPSAGISDYSMVSLPTDLSELSVAFWMKTNDTESNGTPLSYATSPNITNALTITDYSGLVIYVNGVNKVTDVTLNDGAWHHVTFMWSSLRGKWKLYKDGNLMNSGYNLAKGTIVRGGGKLTVGQEQDTVGGGFSSSESFVGQLTHMNIWDSELTYSQIEKLRTNCNLARGNVISWTDFLKGARGKKQPVKSSFCGECSVLRAPESGEISFTGVSPGSIVTYSCDRGHDLVGRGQRRCLVSTFWEFDAPVCELIQCGHPGNIANGYISGHDYVYNKEIKYHCYESYILKGPKKRLCTEFGRWDAEKPTCEKIRCVLPILSNHTKSTQTDRSFLPGAVVSFYCIHNFRLLTPHDSILCQGDGTWDKTVPTCDSDICTDPVPIKNGIVTNHAPSFTVGSAAIYACDDGYTFTKDSKNNVFCLPGGEWEDSIPKCDVITCPDLPPVRHATILGSKYSIYSSVTYVCDIGHDVEGTTVLQCTDEGTWDAQPPYCRPVSCPPLTVKKPLVARALQFIYNSILTYSCMPGYKLDGANNSRCLANKTWSGEIPRCVMINCGEPTKLDNAVFIGEAYNYNDVIQYKCNSGYELKSGGQTRCLLSGMWQRPLPRCERVECGLPKSIANGVILGESFKYNDTIEYVCNVGYEINGDAISTCTKDKFWSKAAPHCVAVMCEPLSTLPNGTVQYNDTLVGSIAKYNCNSGFELRFGSEVRRCQADKTWSGKSPQCVSVTCAIPSNIPNGFIKLPTVPIVGSELIQSCQVGFKLLGSQTRKCLASLEWSGDQASCQIITCQPISIIQNGGTSLRDKKPIAGMVVQYFCDEGYTLVGDSEGVCGYDGQWSGGIRLCKAVHCIQPAFVISNGRMIDTDFSSGAVIRYVCDEGYYITGSTSRRCLQTGLWDSPIPVCEKVSCGVPPKVPNGRYEGFEHVYLSVVKFRCRKRYTLIGETRRTCQSDKTWSGSNPQCILVNCEMPSKIPNGDVVVSSRGFRGRAIYSCNPGYQADVINTLVCQVNSTWDGHAPNCQPILCPPIPPIKNGLAKVDALSFGSAPVVFSCNKGYTLEGADKLFCLTNGTWSSQIPVCAARKCKDIPLIISGGTVNGTSTATDSIRTYSCNAGYKLIGESAIQCLETGEWSAAVPLCLLIDCGRPAVPDDVIITGDNYTSGAIVKYSCKDGFYIVGNKNSRCLSSGLWEGSYPSCKPLACPILEPLTNGVVMVTTYGIGSVAKYRCNEGYILKGIAERVCEQNLKWSFDEPVCIIVSCGIPKRIKYGRSDGLSHDYGAEIQYVCDKGYEIIGQPTRTCTSSGQWSGVEPQCVGIECPPPQWPKNGRVVENTFSFLSVITYVCDDGFEMVGDAYVACLEDKQWSGDAPKCLPLTCPEPPRIEYGNVVGELTFKSVIRYNCYAGYTLKGDSQRTCLSSRLWSGKEPTCVPVSCPSINMPTDVVNYTLTILPSKSDYVYGDVVEFFCSKGYQLVGASKSSCQIDRSWSSDVPTCEKVTCKKITTSTNVIAQYGTSKLGDIVFFSCKLGYVLDGPGIVTCKDSGQWSAEFPKCRPVQCSPPKLANAEFKGDDFALGKVVNIVCHTGYELNGVPQVVCTDAGQWVYNGECIPIRCLTPRIENGLVIKEQSYSYNTEIEVICNDGFVSSSATKLICREDGWLPEVPECRLVLCNKPPELQNALLVRTSEYAKTQYVFKDIYRYSCVYGYELGGSGEIQCGSNGTWVGETPQCNPILCGSPPNIANANVITVTYTLGGLVKYSCVHGYDSHQKMFAECTLNKTWVFEEDFECHLVNCGAPPSVKNARVIAETTTYGSEAVYICDDGYVIMGYNIITCDANKDWVGDLPHCEIVACPSLVTSIGLVLTPNQQLWSIGDRVRFSCDKGYTMVDVVSEISECGVDGKWTSPVPRCTVQYCSELNLTTKIEVVADPIPVGVTVTLACQRGYVARGDMTAKCHDDGSWAQVKGRCHRVSCSRHVPGSNAMLMGRSFLFGDRAVYMCSPGMLPVKVPSVVVCASSGHWQPKPQCKVQCKQQCLNGGVCIAFNRCKCMNGFGGRLCEIPICILPCLNGGSCTAPYRCACRKGFHGSRCQRLRCDPACLNGRQCARGNRCLCHPRLSGPLCDDGTKTTLERPPESQVHLVKSTTSGVQTVTSPPPSSATVILPSVTPPMLEYVEKTVRKITTRASTSIHSTASSMTHTRAEMLYTLPESVVN